MPVARLQLLRDRSELQRLSDWIDDQCHVLDLAGRPAYAVRLCLEEAVLNVLTHGRPALGAPTEITITLDGSADRVLAVVEDHGPPFDPVTVANPPRPVDLMQTEIGGLGLLLMRRYAQRLTYLRMGERNRLEMQFGGV